MTESIDHKRLYWQSRRGMLELDLILVPFFKQCYAGLPEADQYRYEELLKSEDQDLFKWFLKREKPEDKELRKIVDIIVQHAQTAPL